MADNWRLNPTSGDRAFQAMAENIRRESDDRSSRDGTADDLIANEMTKQESNEIEFMGEDASDFGAVRPPVDVHEKRDVIDVGKLREAVEAEKVSKAI